MRKLLWPLMAVLAGVSLVSFNPKQGKLDEIQTDTLRYPEEKHLRNIRQLTFGGDNAEAYFSFDNQWIIFQKTNPKEGIMCDQMFVGKVPAPG